MLKFHIANESYKHPDQSVFEFVMLLTLSRYWMYLTWRGINSSDDIVTWGQCEEQGQAAAESRLRVCTLRKPDPEP